MRMPTKVSTILVSVVMSLVLLAGCTMTVDPNFQLQTNSNQIQPDAGDWQTWVLASTDEVLPAPPPDHAATLAEIEELKALAQERDAAAEALVAYWDAGSPSYRWIFLAIAQHAEARIPPSPRFSRGISLLNVA